ncbi:hypothetical protein, partial [Pseudotabrizicola algicola]|uniref:hypothetical protein n=1 Tax=Pseudotabrizicola algicola TaxID=2709381 RepID=UPI0019680905
PGPPTPRRTSPSPIKTVTIQKCFSRSRLRILHVNVQTNAQNIRDACRKSERTGAPPIPRGQEARPVVTASAGHIAALPLHLRQNAGAMGLRSDGLPHSIPALPFATPGLHKRQTRRNERRQMGAWQNSGTQADEINHTRKKGLGKHGTPLAWDTIQKLAYRYPMAP